MEDLEQWKTNYYSSERSLLEDYWTMGTGDLLVRVSKKAPSEFIKDVNAAITANQLGISLAYAAKRYPCDMSSNPSRYRV